MSTPGMLPANMPAEPPRIWINSQPGDQRPMRSQSDSSGASPRRSPLRTVYVEFHITDSEAGCAERPAPHGARDLAAQATLSASGSPAA
jgi:hypothetical protein